jgi:putative nucleotidyltransferase with HDIG domain
MERNNYEIIDRYLDRVEHLPPAPTVAIKLLDLFSDPDRDIDRIVELIRLDPSLTAATLKRCNSTALRGAEPASDMFEAACRLGFYEIYCIVVGLIASRTMTAVRAKYGLDSARLWRHTVTTAVIASLLAKRIQVVEAAAFTAGLLHDLGKIVFVSVEGVGYAELARNAGLFGPGLVAAEVAANGFSHAELGARLLARWGLPESICLAVQFHHQSPASARQYQRLAATVNLANALAHQMVDGYTNAPAAAEAKVATMALVELKPADIPALMEEIQQAMGGFQELLQMHG